MQKEYLNSGLMNASAVKSKPNSPDYFGDVTLSFKELLGPDWLAILEASDGKVKLKKSGWKKTSTAGKVFLSVAYEKYEEGKYASKKPAVQNDDPF